MKYNEIIHINEKFIPVFDLENKENDKNWPIFIPNDKFRNVLSSVIDSLEDTNNQKNPVWLQGTYGTGKSHATSVIKHLLCDETIPSDFDLESKQLTAKLNIFREKNNVFPVVLKGPSNVNDSRTLKYAIQTAVKNALNEANMRVTIPSEFETMINLLNDGSITLKDEDLEGTNLASYAGYDEIIMRLKNYESNILLEIEDILLDKNLGVNSYESIEIWLTKIRDALNKEYGIDYLIIFWDEFTEILNSLNAGEILDGVQKIAEAKDNGISIFIVSHKTRSNQMEFDEERFKKVMDRFVRINYTMEHMATYELMERSIKKDSGWETVKNRFVDVISPLIEMISENEGSNVKKALENLYPIHPYTSYLATFVAQTIGSTERSIFKFLHEENDYGFRSFINTFEINQRYFLTADFLWDFFYEEFENHEDEKIGSAVERFKLNYKKISEKGEEYLVVFKVILLLNILYKMAQLGKESLAVPSKENIYNVFVGSIYQDDVNSVLEYIDNEGIINSTPDGLFELTVNTLPPDQVNKVIKELKKGLTLNKLLTLSDINNIQSVITKRAIRAIDIKVIDGNIKENKLKNDLDKGLFKNPGYLHLILFLCKTEKESFSLKEKIQSVYNQKLLDDIVIIVSDAYFGEKNLEDYLDYKARSIVYKRHNFTEDAVLTEKTSTKYIDTWINDIKKKPITWYLNEENGRSANLNTFVDKLKGDLSKKIFPKGLENIDKILKNKNLWPDSIAKVQAEKFMTSKSLDELVSKVTGQTKPSLDILKDNNENYIVDSSLNLLDSAPDNHPIVEIQYFVEKTLKNAQKKGKFNLGDELRPLFESPYGLYPNNLNVPALSFVLRSYVNKLYDSKGNSLDSINMKIKVINIFEYWSKGKREQDLYVRFGTKNEKKLTELLDNIFHLDLNSDNQSIDSVRWELRMWIKDNKIPLWLLKYSDSKKPNDYLENSIQALSEFLKPTTDNISDDIIQNCYDELRNIKTDLKLVLKKDYKVLFKNFIDSLNKDVSDEDIPKIIQHIIEIMPEEIHDWDENKVRFEILNWVIDHINAGQDGGSGDVGAGSGVDGGSGDVGANSGGHDNPEDKDIVTKVKNTDPKVLKNVLINVLKENQEMQKIIEVYLMRVNDGN